MRFRAVLGLLLAGVLLGACGSEYTYVANSDVNTYVRLPAEWQPVDETVLAAAFGLDPGIPVADQGVWLEGYDADPAPSATHLIGPDASAPAVFVLVQAVPQHVRGQISLDGLRDFFQPVSATAREQAAGNPMSQRSGFALLSDEVLTPGDGLRGVHVVYRYRLGGAPAQVFDQTVYINDDASTVYVFVARCSVECYTQRQPEIDRVVSSFTVREGP